MDSLLSSFTQKYINKFNEDDLISLSNLLDVDDENLYKFKQGYKTSIKLDDNRVNNLFKNFTYKNK